MRIRRIRVKNFRNLRDVEIQPAETTVLIGENNTGKSNLLHALRLLLDPETRRLEYEISEDDINDIARQEGEDYFSVIIEIGDLQKHQELEAIFRDRVAQDRDETYVTIEGKYERDEDGEYNWKTQLMPPYGRSNEPVPLSNRMARSIPLFFLDAVRGPEREMRATGRGTLSQLLREVDIDDIKDEVVENIQNANEALGKNESINSLANNITELLSPHIPGGQGDISLAVAAADPQLLMKGLTLGLKRKSDLKTYDMLRHGTGLQNLVLIAMFRHRITLSKESKPILAIEEPEAHLHPQAQRCLFKDLEKIENPVILTTHSPAIVECTNPMGLVRLTSNNSNHVTAHQLNPSNIADKDIKVLERMMRSGRADAFFARAIIIVEGPSELIAIPSFAENLSCDLDREGISVISADGNCYSYILNACKRENFSIPSIVTFDTDALEADNQLLKEAYKTGLIDREERDAGKNATSETRQKILEKIGWIPVESNFEEQIGEAGYLDLMLKVIDEEGKTSSLDKFLTRNGLNKDAQGVSEFLSNNNRLKIPIARAVSNEVSTIGKVPACFEKAIKEAVSLSANGNT